MIPINNKKGVALLGLAGVSVGVMVVIAIAVIILSVLGFFGASSFISLNLWSIIGVTGIVMTFIYAVPSALSGEFTREKLGFILILFFVFIFLIFVPKLGIVQTIFSPSESLTQMTTEKELPIDFCSNVAECVSDLEAEGMPENYLENEGIIITCSEKGECIMKRT